MSVVYFASLRITSSPRSVRDLLRKLSLRVSPHLLCHFGSRDATKVARTLCQFFRALRRAPEPQTSRSLVRYAPFRFAFVLFFVRLGKGNSAVFRF
uniref:Uncharacterized protein n=1 Tax=Leptospira ellisii TaxID=2023197 RepID=A0A2N0B364_9LEPT|nr:hypothetical protein CH379_21385 [Leptospira ellisii]